MEQTFQEFTFGFVRKDDTLEVGAIEAAAIVEDFSTEGFDNFLQCGLTRFDHLPGNDVGVDHRNTVVLRECVANCCLTRTYPAGDTDDESPPHNEAEPTNNPASGSSQNSATIPASAR